MVLTNTKEGTTKYSIEIKDWEKGRIGSLVMVGDSERKSDKEGSISSDISGNDMLPH